MGDRASSFIEAAIDLAEAGFYAEAVDALRLCAGNSPMLKYHEAYCLGRMGDAAGARRALDEAASRGPEYCFPNRLEDIPALEYAIAENPSDSRAPYYLGNLWYDRKQYEAARGLWERSASLDDMYPTVWRNLSLCYYNKSKAPERALKAMERAFELDTGDARVFLELDQLRKKLSAAPEERLAQFEKHRETFEQRDDLCAEYATLLNLVGRHEEAYDLIMRRRFHPWEGGEGKVTRQYVTALVQMARAKMQSGDAAAARELLERALSFPHNLGEGKLEGAKDNDVHYYLGLAWRMLGDRDAANDAFERASRGDEEPAGMMYYNDQPADMILYQGLARRELGREDEARARFNRLVDYGERHFFDEARIDYFAVSLPDLQLFDEDLSLRNRTHCRYLIAMGSYGLGDTGRAEEYLDEVLRIDPANQGAVLMKDILKNS
jgi:tetratricopeptide (TPR) repeat protein